jgi:16S rRNA (cytidine1402-2'-O)-methyltransferase
MGSNTTGTLYLVGTPIGNLEDVSLRALRVLGQVAVVAAEDTRRTGRLLHHYEIKKPLLSYYEFNEARRTPELLDRLRAGDDIALVSDAGMPVVSDPGLRLIRAARDEQIRIEIVPGPSAVTAAITGSGLAAGPFLFYGFLPQKSAQRRKRLTDLAPLPYAIVFFESPYRVARSLADMTEILGTDRQAVIAREITKKFEEILRGTLGELSKKLEQRRLKGEITVVVEGRSDE